MEVWTWILAYIVGFSLLQLLVYRYFRNQEASVEQASPRSVERYAAPVEQLEHEPLARPDGGDGVHCQRCGAYNQHESTYRYCRKCVSPLR